MFNVDTVLNRFKEENLKLTPQRIETVKVLAEIGHLHPSLKDVLREVSKRVPTISFSTLYMIIKTLEGLGLVKTFDINGETRVEINMKPHINLIFTGNGEIRDIVDSNLLRSLEDNVKGKVRSHGDYEIDLVNIYLVKT